MSQEPTKKHTSPEKLPTVLVTGAAGGLGVHLVNALSRAGMKVRAFDKISLSDARRTSLFEASDQVEWSTGTGTTEELRRLVSGCEAVVHAAGLVSLSASEVALFRSNAEASRQLFELAAEEGVEHFVLISCASVYDSEKTVRTETSTTAGFNAYERSKLRAEEALRRCAERIDKSPALTVLRLGLLYGPGCTTMGAGLITLPAILREYSRYLPGLSGGPRTNWCHVEDAASAVQLVLETSDARNKVFNVADEAALSFGEVLTSIIEGYDTDLGPSVPIPSVAIWAVLSPLVDNDWAFEQGRSLFRLLWRRMQKAHGLESPLVPRLNRDALFYVRDDAIVLSEALHALGWRAAWPDFRQGIKDTIRWYQEAGWAPRFTHDALVKRRDELPEHRLQYGQRIAGTCSSGEESSDLEMALTVSWPSLPLPPRSQEGHIEGMITIEGLAERAHLKGTVQMRWVPTISLTYEFGFLDKEGQACRFRGERRAEAPSFMNSFQELTGTVIDRRGSELGVVRARCFPEENS